jgi:lipopolysaccharide/colanic/teichoic acid biosynthesis glycosyltransferase
MLMAAIAVKVSDGGPVLFSQTRIGRAGAPFVIHKFRTMVVDAEQRLTEVAHRNEREGGPLFKLDHDPRVTPVGRFLRATSIDELPQLFDVIAGSMSLVGPRPALPSEARQFDARLTGRHDVRPGITGLWQVEGRDQPSFDAYRRCDVYYVENWSLRLDLAILARTVPTVLGRAWHSVRAARSRPVGHDDPGWVPSMGLADRGRS